VYAPLNTKDPVDGYDDALASVHWLFCK
jgi:hypothetical protein